MTTADAGGRPPTTTPRETERAMQIALIKSSIERDQYAVEPRKVAEALLAKVLGRQKACS